MPFSQATVIHRYTQISFPYISKVTNIPMWLHNHCRNKSMDCITVQPLPVVHQQKLNVLHVVDQKLHETTWQHMPRLLVWPVTNVGHQRCSLEFTANPWINTLWPSPVGLPYKPHTTISSIPKQSIPPIKKTHCIWSTLQTQDRPSSTSHPLSKE